MSFSARLYRFLLRVLPTDFRGDFGDAMLADVEAGAHDRLFWWREIGGLLRAVVREHLDALRQDVKYALRMMRRTPGFTAMAIVMLALGTGVNVAMFSVVDAVMIRSPFVDQDRAAIVRYVQGTNTGNMPLQRYRELAAAPGPLEAVAIFGGGDHIMTGNGDPRRVQMECVSAAMFDVLGTRPMIGRVFTADDDHPGAAPKVVLAYGFWQQLGGKPDLVGTTLTLNGRPVTIAGVMPRGYTGALSRLRVDGWMPLEAPVAGAGVNGCAMRSTVNVFARVRAPMHLSDAQASFTDLSFTSVAEQTFDELNMPFTVLSGAVVFVLLIACANVGGLQLERTLARRRELSVRAALGASKGRLARQMLTESVALAAAGAAAGVTATYFSLNALVSLLPLNVPHLGEVAVNGRVLAAAVVMAAVCGVLSALAPILQFRSEKTAPDLSGSGRSTSRVGHWTRQGLVTGQIALSVAVLIGAGLMIQTFITLRPDHPGFDASRKLVNLVRLSGAQPPAAAAFFDDLFARLQAVPGVHGVAAVSSPPMSGLASDVDVSVGDVKVHAYESRVTPTFFPLMKMPLLEGRAITETDRQGAELVAVVNEVLAKKIQPNGSALGTTFVMVNPYLRGSGPTVYRIVGITPGVRNSGIDTRIRPELYRAYAQDPAPALHVVVETDGTPHAAVAAAIAAQIHALRPDLPIEPITPMTDMLASRVVFSRFQAWLLGIFAALAVGLAAVGLMTTLGWWVRQRTRELGVRVALGASPQRLGALVMRQGLTLGAAGIVLGCLMASGLTRLIKGWIYGVTPLDPPTFAGATVLMLAIAALAIFVPMRRATRVDPISALRSE